MKPDELRQYLKVMKEAEVDSIQLKIAGDFELTVTGLAPLVKPPQEDRNVVKEPDPIGLEYLRE